MANITASMVKDLRDKTGAGMMDCKNALSETNGDMEAAIDWLRKKGISKAAKKAGRAAAEGLVGVAVGGDAGALVEVNAETDFVARNDEFKNFVKARRRSRAEAKAAIVEKLLAAQAWRQPACSRRSTELVAKIGENMSVRRAVALSVVAGRGGGLCPQRRLARAGQDRRAGGAQIDRRQDQARGAGQAARDACGRGGAARHDAGASRQGGRRARARRSRPNLARQSGKPETVIEKMMEGRMRKFYEESVLLSQIFVIDGETQVGKVIEKASKELGAAGRRSRALSASPVGEGIEKAESDFADEVAQMAGH